MDGSRQAPPPQAQEAGEEVRSAGREPVPPGVLGGTGAERAGAWRSVAWGGPSMGAVTGLRGHVCSVLREAWNDDMIRRPDDEVVPVRAWPARLRDGTRNATFKLLE